MSEPRVGSELVGTQVELEVGPVAHGGHCVARYDGRVVFVRHTLPGERVLATVTGVGGGGRFLRADAVEVLQAAPGRIEPPCPWSGPGRCGGCDWQHVDIAVQRELKAEVIVEQFARVAGIDLAEVLGGPVWVEPVPGDQDGLGWRTRMAFAVDKAGRPGLRVHRSREVVPVDDCPIAVPAILQTGVLGGHFPGSSSVEVVAPARGEPVVVRLPGPVPIVQEEVAGHRFAVSATGFWQVHPGAAATFAATLLDWLRPQPGERALDLYAGVGSFAAVLADAVGPRGSVTAVESDKEAVRHAKANLADFPWARVRCDRADRAVAGMARRGRRVDLVVLDPPRTGAGRAVVRDLARLRPRAVCYVACDPAALARDTAYLADEGYRLTRLRCLDAFPMTHHVECLALLVPVREDGGGSAC